MNRVFFSILLLLLFVFTELPSNADVVWPSVYIAGGMTSIKVIIAGLIIETIFVKIFTGTKWLKSFVLTFIMNLITSVIGIILIPLSGLGVELIFDIFKTYEKYHIGTFHWSHWICSYFAVIIINTLIEGLFLKLTLKLKFKNIFWWMLIANALSVLICIIFYGFTLENGGFRV